MRIPHDYQTCTIDGAAAHAAALLRDEEPPLTLQDIQGYEEHDDEEDAYLPGE